jgi:nephrocystin-4
LFEEKMLETVRNHYYEEHPEEISIDNEGELAMPQIVEARMHVGFHNSFNFVQPPIIINLLRNSQEENTEKSLEFLGNIKLEYLHDAGIELVFGVEYKILISVKGFKEEKGGFTKLVERLSTPTRVKEADEIYGIEKFATVGWSHCSLNNMGTAQKITLDSGSKPNPFSSLIYHANTQTYKLDRERLDVEPDSAYKPLPLELEYLIQNETAASVPSPVLNLPVTVEKLVETTFIEPTPRPITPAKQVIIEEEILEIEEVAEVLVIKNDEFSPLPALPSPGFKNVLSRIQKSRLFHAGFEKFYDENGKLPTVIEVSSLDDRLKCDIDLELKDQRDNEVTLQFMALTLTDDFKSKMAGDLPSSVTFSFQFYTFPNISTERLKIYTGSLPPNYQKAPQHNRSSTSPLKKNSGLENTNHAYSSDTINNTEPESWPGIFYRIEQDGRPACNTWLNNS